MANAEFNQLTAAMLDAERDVIELKSKLVVAEATLRGIKEKRNVIWQQMITAATVST